MYLNGDNPAYSLPMEGVHYPTPVLPTSRPLGMNMSRLPEGTIQGSPGREEGEVPETDIDPDTRRRLLILQHGMDAGRKDPPSLPTSLQVQIPQVVAPAGGWLGTEEEMSPRRPTRRSPELVLEPESPSFENRAMMQGPPGFENPYIREQQLLRESRRKHNSEEVYLNERCFFRSILHHMMILGLLKGWIFAPS